jgi:hypothetical protein
MMPMSQIDMVILLDDTNKWLQVCGGLKREPDRVPGRAARLYVVVRQGDVIATGEGTCEYDEHAKNTRWVLDDVKVPDDIKVPDDLTTQRLQVGSALACGVAIVEKDHPAGLEVFSWVQEVHVRTGSPWTNPPPIDFSEAELAVSAHGKLDAAEAIASSLAIRPSDGGGYRWTCEIETRAVEEAQIV